MMRYVKNLSIALLALGIMSPVLADDILNVPSQKGGFKIAIDPLYLRKNDVSNLGESNYDWGTFAQISYLFPYTGNDLTVDYTYLRTGEKESLDLDAANLTVGQRLTTGAFDFRLFSGVRYTHLNYLLDLSTPENKQSITNLFHGFGPSMGVDARYRLADSCFGFDTHINTSLVIGTINTRSQNDSASKSSSMQRIVPELDTKIGIDYTYPFAGDSKSVFAVELGYQTNNHFNTFNTDFIRGSGDASFDGIYLDFKYYS